MKQDATPYSQESHGTYQEAFPAKTLPFQIPTVNFQVLQILISFRQDVKSFVYLLPLSFSHIGIIQKQWYPQITTGQTVWYNPI